MQTENQTQNNSAQLERITPQPHTYQVGNINFIVTPVYPSGRGESMSAILLKLMQTDIESTD